MTAIEILTELLLPTLASLVLILGFRSPTDTRWAHRLRRADWWTLFALTRVVYPIVLLGWLGATPVSDSKFWTQSSDAGLAGQVAGEHFNWPYAPLLAQLQLWGRSAMPGEHWAGTLLPFVAGDLLAVVTGTRLARRAAPSLDPRWVLGWLVLTPLLWHQLIVRGQDESLFVGMLTAAALAAACGRPTLSGLVLGAGALITKVTFLPFAAVVVVALAPRPRQALRAGAAALAVALPGVLLWPPELPTRVVEETAGIGLSLTDGLTRLTGLSVASSLAILALAALALILVLLRGGGRGLSSGRRAILGLAAMHCVVMLFMPGPRSPNVAQQAVAVLLVVATLPGERWRDRAVVVWILLGWVTALVWTQHRAFTISLKLLSWGFHGALLLAIARELIRPPADASPTAAA
jgi:hypothetical protein